MADDMGPIESTPIVHIATGVVRVGTRLRQRCGWCGALLIDVDLAGVAMMAEDAARVAPDDMTGGYPVWADGSLVAVDGGHGGHSWAVDLAPGDLPSTACANIDDEVTR